MMSRSMGSDKAGCFGLRLSLTNPAGAVKFAAASDAEGFFTNYARR
jgi:hypothetical protein